MTVWGMCRFLSVFFMKLLQDMFVKSMIFHDFRRFSKQKPVDFQNDEIGKQLQHFGKQFIQSLLFFCCCRGMMIVYRITFRFSRKKVKKSSKFLYQIISWQYTMAMEYYSWQIEDSRSSPTFFEKNEMLLDKQSSYLCNAKTRRLFIN